MRVLPISQPIKVYKPLFKGKKINTLKPIGETNNGKQKTISHR